MKNLAGDPNCDKEIRRELARARIEIVEGARSTHEVAASVTGKLGHITFTRAWYYWVAEGKVPFSVATELWNDPVGRTDVRVGGHCGCPSPAEYGTTYYDADGKVLYEDKTGEEERRTQHFVDKGIITPEDQAKYRFVQDKRAAANVAFVSLYHIDSEVGLRLFADAIRALNDGLP
jgi:hypothetical protein